MVVRRLVEKVAPREKAGMKVRAAIVFVAAATLPFVTLARGPGPGEAENARFTTNQVLPVVELPAQGKITYRLIRQGGPFPHEKDGIVFGNRERLLPSQRRGYYREYTVDTPGARNRGARRIVCGGPARTPVACYYTSDHYSSFRRLVEARE